MQSNIFNLGILRGRIPYGNKIVYYRRGLNELSLNITNACPNRCVFCIRDFDPGWKVSNLYLFKDPVVSEIIKAFDSESEKIKKQKIKLKKVKICGYGEPILRADDLFPILNHIKNSYPGVAIQLTTTGWPYFRYISNDILKLKELKTAGLTDIYLSLNTPNKKDYLELIRPGVGKMDPLAFEDGIRFCIAAKDIGLTVTLGFINLAGLKENDVKKLAGKLEVAYIIRGLEK
jgi:TatD family-associated radical SAM protein